MQSCLPLHQKAALLALLCFLPSHRNSSTLKSLLLPMSQCDFWEGAPLTVTWLQLISNEELLPAESGEQGEKLGGGSLSECKYIKPFNSVDSGLPGCEWELIHSESKSESAIQSA